MNIPILSTFLLIFNFIKIICVYACVHKYECRNACMYIYYLCEEFHGGQNMASDPLKPELDDCEPPCGCWDLNPGLLKE